MVNNHLNSDTNATLSTSENMHIHVLPIILLLLALSLANNTAVGEPDKTISYAEMTVSPRGLGPIQIGMTMGRVSDLLGVDAKSGKYSYGDYECGSYYLGEGGEYGAIRLLTAHDVVARIDIYVPEIRTENGLGKGSAMTDIQQAFGSAATKRVGHYFDTEILVSLEGTNNKYLFIGSESTVHSFRVGSEPEVQYIEGCL